MHHAMVKINYLSKNCIKCYDIKTRLINARPFDGSNLKVEYEATLIKEIYDRNKDALEIECAKIITENSYEDVVESCRKFFVELEANNKHSTVDNSLSTAASNENF